MQLPIGDGAVSLFFDNVSKAQTRIDGFNVDGTLETNTCCSRCIYDNW